ncbi:NAD(P)/FAD-dependent oxidoreductase [Candidatus Dojkabacteria bacterium]|nr:NAD(P)/FAD-dependent oxidoreductase [Candidatus Dojkabacteria bacterium]
METLKYDVVIIGTGFAGLSCAHKLDKSLRVLIIDRKPSLKITYNSTGIITESTKDVLSTIVPDINEYITFSAIGMGVVAPDFADYFIYSDRKPWAFSTDTEGLVRRMQELLPSNVDVMFGTTFVKKESDTKISVSEIGVIKKIKFRFIVGADGVSSMVAKAFKLSVIKRKLLGIEKTFLGEVTLSRTPAVYHYWNREFGRGYGGWIAPTKFNTKSAIRVGLGAYNATPELLEKFISVLKAKGHIKVIKEVSELSGFLPLDGPVSNYYRKNGMIIGDAAGLCGPWSGDGIKGALVSGIVSGMFINKWFRGEHDFKSFYKEIDKYGKTYSLFRHQKFYRLVWDLVKEDSTFKAFYEIVKLNKTELLGGLKNIKKGDKSGYSILKPLLNPIPLIKFGVMLIRDIIFIPFRLKVNVKK